VELFGQEWGSMPALWQVTDVPEFTSVRVAGMAIREKVREVPVHFVQVILAPRNNAARETLPGYSLLGCCSPVSGGRLRGRGSALQARSRTASCGDR
jgi:hypothetical protein